MNPTIRNVDEPTYRQLKARAALTGRTIGDLVTGAIRCYLARPLPFEKTRSLADLEPEDYGPGHERASQEIDALVYGT